MGEGLQPQSRNDFALGKGFHRHQLGRAGQYRALDPDEYGLPVVRGRARLGATGVARSALSKTPGTDDPGGVRSFVSHTKPSGIITRTASSPEVEASFSEAEVMTLPHLYRASQPTF